MTRARSILTGILVGLALLVSLGLGIRLNFLVANRIAPGVRVAGVEVGGLTKEEAAVRLRRWSRRHLAGTLTLMAAGRKWTGTLRDMGVTADPESMARAAYAVGRRGSVLTKLAEGLGILRKAKTLPGVYCCDRRILGRLLAKVRAAVAIPAKDARLSFSNGVRKIIPEVPGRTIDLDGSLDLILSAVARGEAKVVLPMAADQPKVTARDLEQVDTLLSSFTTFFPAWRRDRTHNIKTAVSRIDGTLVKPGQVFSYNATVGPREKENGFKEALIYINGKIIPGTGGGVCQVSSTVYNAALLANMEIIERNHHSMPVPYVPLGRDATVAYGLLDLKFRNTTSAPIYLAARVAGSRLTIQIYGASRDKKDVRIYTARAKRGPGGRSLSRMAVVVYRAIVKDGKEESRQRISYDQYSPAPAHITVPRPKPVRTASRA